MELLISLFLPILNMTITASYAIIAVLVIRLLIKRAPKSFSYILWLVVGFRLLCPISFSSIISMFNFNAFQNGTTQYQSGIMNYIPMDVANPGSLHMTTKVSPAVNTTGSGFSAAVSTTGLDMAIIINVATILWIAGIILFMTYSTLAYIKLRSKVSKAVLLKDNIFECDQIPSPFVLGIIKPRIYIPFRLKEEELGFILAHEKYHIKRFDYIVKPLSFLLLIIYWFNPLIWVAYWCMTKDMEMSCDEKVISEIGTSVKNDYSLSLLAFATNKRFLSVGPLAFGETNTKGRINNILTFKKPKLGLSMLLVILCLFVIGACATNAKKPNDTVKSVVTGQAKKQTANQAEKQAGNQTQKKAENRTKEQAEKEVSSDDKNTTDTDSSDTQIKTDYAQTLYNNRVSYIGDASADGKLLFALGIEDVLGNYKLKLETDKKPYILQINFDKAVLNSDQLDQKMVGYATLLLALIDNVDEIQWSYPYHEDGKSSQIRCSWTEQNLQTLTTQNIKGYGKTKEKVQELLDILDSNAYKINSGS